MALGLRIIPTPADGLCLAHAIVFILRRLGIFRWDDGRQLRIEIAKTFLDNVEQFWDFMPSTYQERQDGAADYFHDIAYTNEWSGHLELRIIQYILGLPIHVYGLHDEKVTRINGQGEDDTVYDLLPSPDSGPIVFERREERRPICIAYDGNHYSAVVRTTAPTPNPFPLTMKVEPVRASRSTISPASCSSSSGGTTLSSSSGHEGVGSDRPPAATSRITRSAGRASSDPLDSGSNAKMGNAKGSGNGLGVGAVVLTTAE